MNRSRHTERQNSAAAESAHALAPMGRHHERPGEQNSPAGFPESWRAIGLASVPRYRLPAASCDILSPKQEGKKMSATPENVIVRAIHEAFIKYPEGDGGQNLDYQWIQLEQSSHVAKVILLELAASGFRIVNDSA
jgi:hypothetical protein